MKEGDVPVLIRGILGITVMDDERFTIRIVGGSDTALDPSIEN
jgi:hypothetical protein